MTGPFWYAPLAGIFDSTRRRLLAKDFLSPLPTAAPSRDWTDDDIPAPNIEERPFVRYYDCSARRFGKTLAVMGGKEAPS